METLSTYNWTQADFRELAQVRGLPGSWADYEFAQRSRNQYRVVVPAGWRPSSTNVKPEAWQKSNSALWNIVLVAAIFIGIPWIMKKTRYKHKRF